MGSLKLTEAEWRIYASVTQDIIGSDDDLSPVAYIYIYIYITKIMENRHNHILNALEFRLYTAHAVFP